MIAQYWLRWSAEHGAARAILRWRRRKGDSFADLLSGQRGLHDPYPLIDRLRAPGGLVRTAVSYAAFEHSQVRAILRDNRFGVRQALGGDLPAPWRSLAARVTVPPNPVEPPSMLVLDPPEHTRMRKPVASAFTPRAIARLRDRVEVVTAELLDAMPAHGSVDLITDFAARVPIAIIAEMLGFPAEDREMFLRWGDRVTPLLDIGTSWATYRDAMIAIESMDEYLAAHIAKLRREPGDDILSTLVTSGDLNLRELQAGASLLMGAGFETTVNLIGNAVAALSAHPDQLAIAQRDPDRWADVVEETLRFDPPVQTTARETLEAVELDGVRLRPGSTVILSLAGANRDPAVFPDPHRFDIDRPNLKDHVAFSSGVHSCLGASLARMEAVHALRALYTRYPDLRLRGEPTRRNLFTLHGFEHMPVDLGPVARAASPDGLAGAARRS
ncbi:cytochrome P450 [Nocardia asteroides]|uniref:cytochrome P450 n=1 Tax=Nocardia asteroides TaxID=1824 RepID=UPI001E2AF703|nr:cytochrome P450 [Nocardia asteroides]UGT57441.1 cytochrome P450 [Nocardia asteroides]